MPSSPRTKRAPSIKRQLFDNNYFIGAIFGLFVLAVLGALYLVRGCEILRFEFAILTGLLICVCVGISIDIS